MFANTTVPDQRLDDPRQDEEMTPEQELDDGDKQAAEAFVNYVRSDEMMEQELFDYLLQEADNIIVRSWIRHWSAKVQRGEL